MESTKYIGRVGALAVALGIGTALTSGTGIAWAEDGHGSAGKAGTSSSDGGPAKPDTKPSAGKTSTTRKPATAPSGALSKIGERVRKEVESGLGEVGEAVKRTQSRLDTARTPQRTATAKVRAKIQGTLVTAPDPGEKVKNSRSKADVPEKVETSRIAPEATATEPGQRRALRPDTVVVRLDEATERMAQRSHDVVSTVRTQVATFDAADIADALIAALQDSDEVVRNAAAHALADLKDPAAALPLLEALAGSDDPFVVAGILRALKPLRHPQAQAPALARMQHADPGVRREAVAVIGWLKQPANLPALIERAQHDDDADVRRAVTGALV